MRVLLFARARELVGTDVLDVVLPDAATVGELRRRLAKDCPRLAGLLQRCAIAVNSEYVGDETQLAANAEVAVLPPVSGG